MKACLQEASLNDMETMYHHGTISEQEAIEYLQAWNDGPHYMQCVLHDGAFRLFDPEQSSLLYRQFQGQFHLHLL